MQAKHVFVLTSFMKSIVLYFVQLELNSKVLSIETTVDIENEKSRNHFIIFCFNVWKDKKFHISFHSNF